MGRLFRWLGCLLVGLIAAAGIYVCFLVGVFVWTRTFPKRLTVAGRVTDSGGKPIQGAEVRAVPVGSSGAPLSPPRRYRNPTTSTVSTDINGRYRLNKLFGWIPVSDIGPYVREYEIVADAAGYAPRKIHASGYNRRLEGIDFALDKEASMSGRAIDTRGRPLVGRALQPVLRNESWKGVRARLPNAVMTDPDGKFRFSNLSAGMYSFRVEGYPDSVPKWWYSDPLRRKHYVGDFFSAQIGLSKPIALDAGQNLEGVEVVFEAPEDRGDIAGHVTDTVTGEPVNEFTVKVVRVKRPGEGTPVLGRFQSGDGYKLISILKGEQGDFRFEDISPGTATLQLKAPGHATTESKVKITSGHTVERTFPLAREACVQGTVYYEGEPKGYANVALRRVGSKGLYEQTGTHAGKNGQYELKALSEGKYLATCQISERKRRDEIVRWTDHAYLDLKASETVRQDFHFRDTSSGIRGRFLSRENAFPWIVVKRQHRDLSTSTTEYYHLFCLVRPTYEIRGIPPGKYTVTGECRDRVPDWVTLERMSAGGLSEIETPVMATSKTVTINPGEFEQVDFDFSIK